MKIDAEGIKIYLEKDRKMCFSDYGKEFRVDL